MYKKYLRIARTPQAVCDNVAETIFAEAIYRHGACSQIRIAKITKTTFRCGSSYEIGLEHSHLPGTSISVAPRFGSYFETLMAETYYLRYREIIDACYWLHGVDRDHSSVILEERFDRLSAEGGARVDIAYDGLFRAGRTYAFSDVVIITA